jgi:hypothetical protein
MSYNLLPQEEDLLWPAELSALLYNLHEQHFN